MRISKSRHGRQVGKRSPRGSRANRKWASQLQIGLTCCPKGLATQIRRVTEFVLVAHGISQGELEIAFVTSAVMKRLHRRWLGKSSATDVITFDLRAPTARPTKRVAPTVDGQIV